MPLTALQRQILKIIVGNRSEESHFGGGITLNESDTSPRFSKDFDIFHQALEQLCHASEQDVATLEAAGFQVVKVAKDRQWQAPSSFRKARVIHGNDFVELDWCHDSAYRFFPIEQDEQLGWRLHMFDVATNKALALAARTETRDYVDIVELQRRFPLAAIIWAAVGKDPGFNPLSLLKMMLRFARINPLELDKIKAQQLDPITLKEEWIAAADKAQAEINALADDHPDLQIGTAFVNDQGVPGWPGSHPELQVHHPSLRGCWPVLSAGKDESSR